MDQVTFQELIESDASNFKQIDISNSSVVVDGCDFCSWSCQGLGDDDEENLTYYSRLASIFRCLKAANVKLYVLFGYDPAASQSGSHQQGNSTPTPAYNDHTIFPDTKPPLAFNIMVHCLRDLDVMHSFLYGSPYVVGSVVLLAATLDCPVLGSKSVYYSAQYWKVPDDYYSINFIPLSLNPMSTFTKDFTDLKLGTVSATDLTVQAFIPDQSALFVDIPPARRPLVNILFGTPYLESPRLPISIMSSCLSGKQRLKSLVRYFQMAPNTSPHTFLLDVQALNCNGSSDSYVDSKLYKAWFYFVIPLLDILFEKEVELYSSWGIKNAKTSRLDHLAKPLFLHQCTFWPYNIAHWPQALCHAVRSMLVSPAHMRGSRSSFQPHHFINRLHFRILCDLQSEQHVDEDHSPSTSSRLLNSSSSTDDLLVDLLSIDFSSLPMAPSALTKPTGWCLGVIIAVFIVFKSTTTTSDSYSIASMPLTLATLTCCIGTVLLFRHQATEPVESTAMLHYDKLAQLARKLASGKAKTEGHNCKISHSSQFIACQWAYSALQSLVALIDCLVEPASRTRKLCPFLGPHSLFPSWQLVHAISLHLSTFAADERVEVARMFWLPRLLSIRIGDLVIVEEARATMDHMHLLIQAMCHEHPCVSQVVSMTLPNVQCEGMGAGFEAGNLWPTPQRRKRSKLRKKAPPSTVRPRAHSRDGFVDVYSADAGAPGSAECSDQQSVSFLSDSDCPAIARANSVLLDGASAPGTGSSRNKYYSKYSKLLLERLNE